MSRTLSTINVKDFARHKVGEFEVEDRIYGVGDFAYITDRMLSIELCMSLNGMHGRLDGTQCNGIHPDTTLGILDRQRFGRCIQSALC